MISGFLAAAAMVFFAGGTVLAGQEFRSFQPIPSPREARQAEADLEAQGFQKLASAQNVPTVAVEKAVQELFAAWNTPALDKKLAKGFPNKSRLIDAIQGGVPRAVRLQVLAVRNPRVVEQFVRPHPDGDGSYQVLSRVSVSVLSQVAASSGVSHGFIRARGTSDYLISIRQKVRA